MYTLQKSYLSMAKLSSSSSSMSKLLILLFITTQLFHSFAISETTTTTFIKSQCSTTTYPSVCIQSLSIYSSTIQQSQYQLVQAALSVSYARAQTEYSFMRKLNKFKNLRPIEYAAIKDCIEEMGDHVDRLGSSLNELKNMGRANGPDFKWHMSNIQTWVSAALTDGSTCVDGFSGPDMNARIRWSIGIRVTNVAKVTSNALSLVNQYAATT